MLFMHTFPSLDLYKMLLDLVKLYLFHMSMLIFYSLVDLLDVLELWSYLLVMEFLWNGLGRSILCNGVWGLDLH